MDINGYHLAASLEDAIASLAAGGGQARLIAGGTDLVLQRRDGTHDCRHLVDISRVPGLDRIEAAGNVVSIGAMVTHAAAASSPIIQRMLPALAQACSQVGSPQVRNMGTLVGNIVSAQPGADAALALHAFDSAVKVAGPNGERVMPLASLYAGLGLCCVDSAHEVITHILVRDIEGVTSAFERLSQRRTLTLPVINTAVSLKLSGDGPKIAKARIALGPVSAKPFRAKEAEEILNGAEPANEVFEKAALSAADESKPRDSLLRGSSEYRGAMVAVLVERALNRALGRESVA